MSALTRNELKRELLAQGFEVYRTLSDRIVLADRVRDNLIMDSGVAAGIGEPLRVRLVLRAQGSDFPGESQQELLARVRGMGASERDVGYVEVETLVVPIRDPGDRDRILDTWYEVAFERAVDSLSQLTDELRRVLKIEKAVGPLWRG